MRTYRRLWHVNCCFCTNCARLPAMKLEYARQSRQRAGLERMLEFAESLTCRTAALVAHFGATPAKPRCARCDACDRVHRRRAS